MEDEMGLLDKYLQKVYNEMAVHAKDVKDNTTKDKKRYAILTVASAMEKAIDKKLKNEEYETKGKEIIIRFDEEKIFEKKYYNLLLDLEEEKIDTIKLINQELNKRYLKAGWSYIKFKNFNEIYMKKNDFI
jgi:hypothetical protein